MKKLKARVDALEGGSVSSARSSSRLPSSSSTVNLVDPLDTAYAERAGGGVVRADNTINLGSGPAQGPAAGAVDPVSLQRTIQHLLRAELQSESVRGAVTF